MVDRLEAAVVGLLGRTSREPYDEIHFGPEADMDLSVSIGVFTEAPRAALGGVLRSDENAPFLTFAARSRFASVAPSPKESHPSDPPTAAAKTRNRISVILRIASRPGGTTLWDVSIDKNLESVRQEKRDDSLHPHAQRCVW